MKINVTWEDIRHGQEARTTECMVALALKRELGVSYASVGYGDATVLSDGESVRVYLPPEVTNKIKLWDCFHFVLPFSFELRCSGFLTGRSLDGLASSTTNRSARRALRAELLEAHA